MTDMLVPILSALFFAWLIMLSYIVIKLKKHYSNLVQTTGKQSLSEVLDSLLQEEKNNRIHLKQQEIQITRLQTLSLTHYAKVGLVNFHPFGKTGGDQSFVLALLNEKKDGIVLNFIYTHEGVRIYAKIVKMGKGEAYELSVEENEAIHSAK